MSDSLENAQAAMVEFQARQLDDLEAVHGEVKAVILMQGARLVTGVVRLREMASRTMPQLATIVGAETEINAVALVVRQLTGKDAMDESILEGDKEEVVKWITILKAVITAQEQKLRDTNLSLLADKPRIVVPGRGCA